MQNTDASLDHSAGAGRHAPATLRNRDPILAVLPGYLGGCRAVLEIASGTGEHAAYLAPRLGIAELIWQPSDYDAENLAGIDAHAAASDCSSILPACRIDVAQPDWAPPQPCDAIFCANMIHIAPWTAAEGLFAGAGRLLPQGGPLILYGPYRRDGVHTAPSNADFDASLQARDPSWGVRDLEGEVVPLARRNGLSLDSIDSLPANNLIVIFRKD